MPAPAEAPRVFQGDPRGGERRTIISAQRSGDKAPALLDSRQGACSVAIPQPQHGERAMTEDEKKIAYLEGQIAGLASYISEIMARMPPAKAEDAWEHQGMHPDILVTASIGEDRFSEWQSGYGSIKMFVGAMMPGMRERLEKRS